MQIMLFCIFFVVLYMASHALGLPQGEQQDRFCSDFSDSGYFCVPYFQCDDRNKIITDGGGIVDPRSADDCKTEPNHDEALYSKCGKMLEICCQLPEQTINSTNCITNNGENIDEEENENGSGFVDRIVVEELPTRTRGQCGKRNNEALSAETSVLKSSSVEANFGEWPHVCAVLRKDYVGQDEQLVKVYLCGASLIADSVVLTAGHCVNNTESLENKLVVRCGEWDTQSEEETLPFQEQKVDRIEKHPDFNADNHHYNFALLFLESSFRASSHISPVCLPKPGLVLAEQNCVSHGWGKDKFGAEGRYSLILKEVVVPLVESNKCEKLFRENTRLGRFFRLDSSFICAGGEKDVDTCKGDGGSPLTCKHPGGPWIQAGIVSWGLGCGEENIPAVYANVAEASCWIDSAVKCYMGQSDSFFGFDEADCTMLMECPDRREPLDSDIFS